ncbi:hypothetical protein [Anaeromicropila populeti]|uniref:Transporter n=1 Tax=Anaeromicropila populeti TaxID=37658 RepID=A0A1I6KM43_9FIRM|nr:hypothetical protein [Anaeromicropila populeti]SFR92276.1 hypothetical protein SAMN05661086_02531 [Anaeromicropila populeti]
MRENLRKLLQEKVYSFTYVLEIIIALFIIIAIALSIIHVPQEIGTLWNNLDDTYAFSNFLKLVFDIVIGIEFIKMLCRHDLNSVIEVLLFATARQMIVEHMSMTNGLIGVLAIGLLFAIRKYLYIEKDSTNKKKE